MPLFQAKIVWKRPRRRENKNYCFVPFLPDALYKIPKKLKKTRKHLYGIISRQNCLENAKKVRKKKL